VVSSAVRLSPERGREKPLREAGKEHGIPANA
jgi:hypothetical protein